jgi:hypothetical protein
VGVYPDLPARMEIEKYLATLDFQEGLDWWYI